MLCFLPFLAKSYTDSFPRSKKTAPNAFVRFRPQPPLSPTDACTSWGPGITGVLAHASPLRSSNFVLRYFFSLPSSVVESVKSAILHPPPPTCVFVFASVSVTASSNKHPMLNQSRAGATMSSGVRGEIAELEDGTGFFKLKYNYVWTHSGRLGHAGNPHTHTHT